MISCSARVNALFSSSDSSFCTSREAVPTQIMASAVDIVLLSFEIYAIICSSVTMRLLNWASTAPYLQWYSGENTYSVKSAPETLTGGFTVIGPIDSGDGVGIGLGDGLTGRAVNWQNRNHDTSNVDMNISNMQIAIRTFKANGCCWFAGSSLRSLLTSGTKKGVESIKKETMSPSKPSS